jgi:hypothetical protein
MITAREQWVVDHPGLQSEEQRRCSFPILIHGDEAEYLDDQKLFIVSWEGGLATGNSLATRFLVAAIPTRRCVKRGTRNATLDALLTFIVWSFEHMLLGRWPTDEYDAQCPELQHAPYRRANAGHALAGSFAATFSGTKGDLNWMFQVYQFTRNWMSNAVCPECHATQTDPSTVYTNVEDDAGWLQSDGQFAPTSSPLSRVTGWHPETIWKDPMHMIYVNGCGNDLAAAVIIDCCRKGLWGHPRRALDVQLTAAYVSFRQWCTANHVATTHDGFSRNSLHYKRNKDFPFLSGKAADVRVIILWLAHTLPAHGPEYQSIACCIAHLGHFIQKLSTSGMLLSCADAAEMRDHGIGFVRTYVRLAHFHVNNQSTLYKVRPKLHYCHHMFRNIKALSPNFGSCFMNEDYMGKIARIAARTHRRTTGLRVLQRFRFSLAREIYKHNLIEYASSRFGRPMPVLHQQTCQVLCHMLCIGNMFNLGSVTCRDASRNQHYLTSFVALPR